jgi:hypothetical protein
MANNADQTVKSAEASTSNGVGMCLQWSRQRAAIASKYPDAATAWRNAVNRHPGDRNPPRGAMVYWTGGSKGYGHIAVSLGGGKIRSSDANGNGKPATVDIGWPEKKWGMPYAGWADNVNSVAIPGVVTPAPTPSGDDDMPNYDHAVLSKSVKIPAGQWVGIAWDKVPSGSAIKPGGKLFGLGGRRYSAALHATVTAPGGMVRIRAVEIENSDTAESNPQTATPANTKGTTYPEYAHNGAVKKGRTLAFRVYCDQAATLTAADVVLLSW